MTRSCLQASRSIRPTQTGAPQAVCSPRQWRREVTPRLTPLRVPTASPSPPLRCCCTTSVTQRGAPGPSRTSPRRCYRRSPRRRAALPRTSTRRPRHPEQQRRPPPALAARGRALRAPPRWQRPQPRVTPASAPRLLKPRSTHKSSSGARAFPQASAPRLRSSSERRRWPRSSRRSTQSAQARPFRRGLLPFSKVRDCTQPRLSTRTSRERSGPRAVRL